MSKGGLLEDILNDMENGVYNFCKDGKCIGCGKCCSNFLPLNTSEIKQIKSYVKKHNITEFKHLFPTINITIDMTCPFLDESKDCNKCKIYEVRPRICREFQCNKPPSQIKVDKARFWNSRSACDMREVFFGGN